MATGRPDYWYGTVVTLDDSPVDGRITRGITSNWAYDHKADVDAHHTQGHFFTDRGDVAAYDKSLGDLTTDGAFHDWDLSALIPTYPAVVFLRVTFRSDTVGEYIQFRENGNSNEHNADSHLVLVANVFHRDVGLVMTDANGVIEYAATGGGVWNTINILVRGSWALP
jgi:hypothetical protein